jgi:chemotaxis protein methyltransferase CheR
MPFDAESLGLHPAALPLVRDLVHERVGLFYGADRLDALGDRLAPLVTDRGFGSFLDYYYFLKYDPASEIEWSRVMDVLTVPETYFWREMDQVHAIVNCVVPELAKRVGSTPLRIWSVPCASGEEPLTIAMALDLRGWFDRISIELRAGDASPAALARAREGKYRERSFRSLPPAIKERYFHRKGDVWQVDRALHARVTAWRQVNVLYDADAAAIAHTDVLFCRNMFIYFSEGGVRKVVQTFADEMPTPSYLCVGASESLLRITDRFELEEVDGAFIYAKRAGRPEQNQ